MDSTFKIVLDTRRAKKNGTYPLRIRVFQGRKYSTHSLSIDLRLKDWDDQTQQVKKSNPNHSMYNARIASAKADIQKNIFLNDGQGDILPSGSIRGRRGVPHQKADIFLYGQEHLLRLTAAGQVGNARAYKCALSKLKSYVGKETLAFEDVNYAFLDRFNTAMLSEGLKVNAISNYLRTLRALFNRALREDLFPQEAYPFTKFNIKSEKTINRTLTLDDVRKIAQIELPSGSPIRFHRNLFLLSFALMGINFADLLTARWQDIQDSRLIFRRKKTRKVYSVKLHGCVDDLLADLGVLQGVNTSEYILPVLRGIESPLKLMTATLQAIKITNKYLKRIAVECSISKEVTTYFARYSWANGAKSLGFTKDLISEALGHEYGNKVTGIYLDQYGAEEIDRMNETVLAQVFDGVK